MHLSLILCFCLIIFKEAALLCYFWFTFMICGGSKAELTSTISSIFMELNVGFHTTKQRFKTLTGKVKMKTNVLLSCSCLLWCNQRLRKVIFFINTSPVKQECVQLWPSGTQYPSVHRMPSIALNTLCDPPYPSLLSLSIFYESAFPWRRQKQPMVSQISMKPCTTRDNFNRKSCFVPSALAEASCRRHNEMKEE